MKINYKDIEISISDGNMKTGAIAAFSLTPGRTCSKEACATCYKEGCYARKSYRMYPSVRKAWDANTDVVENNLAAFEKAMNTFFSGMNAPRFFRIHVSGDFVTKEYAKTWARIARKNPGTKFLAFTKQWANINGVRFPENFSLVLSGWNGVSIPENLTKKYPVAFCIENGQEMPKNAIECPGHCDTCGMCWNLKKTGKDVAFRKH